MVLAENFFHKLAILNYTAHYAVVHIVDNKVIHALAYWGKLYPLSLFRATSQKPCSERPRILRARSMSLQWFAMTKRSQCNIRQRRKLYTWALGWPSWHGWHREHCPQTGSPRKLQQLPVNLLTIHNFSSLAALRICCWTWRHMMAVDWNLRSLVEQSDWAISRMTREKGIWRSKIVVHISSHMNFL